MYSYMTQQWKIGLIEHIKFNYSLRDLLSRHSLKLIVATSAAYKWEATAVYKIYIVYREGKIS